ncbi:MAG: SPFH domain-containing protein [Candidatus Moraniibacteriota bacterium]
MIIGIILIIFGIIMAYLGVAFRYVPPPEKWVVEINFPGKGSIKKPWDSGIHFLWLPIKPFMFVRNKLNCADEAIDITIGVDDDNPGGKSLVEFVDVSAGVHCQIVLKVIDPIRATYEIGDYKEAAIQRVESNFRKFLGSMKLDDAMQDVDKRSAIAKDNFIDVNNALAKWGVAITNAGNEITIIDFILSSKTIDQRDKLIAAQKDFDVTIKTAEGEKQKAVLAGKGYGEGEVEKIKIIAKELSLEPTQVIEYLLKLGMLKAIDGSTIIATSEGGKLNTPIDLASVMFAIDNARSKNTQKGATP